MNPIYSAITPLTSHRLLSSPISNYAASNRLCAFISIKPFDSNNFLLLTVNMGGSGNAQNIFKINRGIDPPEVFNRRLWFAVFSFGIMGAARGWWR